MMSSEIVANVENLSKCYYFCGTPWRRLEHAIFGNPKKGFREFWALRDVSFEVTKGETLGIVGENGSGKSTLLQILCGIISPTSGTLSVTGRVATILELGAGFNQEFTGKENIYMSATILGLSDKEVDEVYEDIAAFADIGDFLEQPVKTYSSGMCIRLAFSIAISVNAEILIIDEALAVGDMYFQTKCMNRLKFLIHSGVTLIFVSHDLAMMRAICDKCLFLEHGKMIAYGKASDVLNIYEEKIHLKMNKVFKNNLADNGEGLSKS